MSDTHKTGSVYKSRTRQAVDKVAGLRQNQAFGVGDTFFIYADAVVFA